MTYDSKLLASRCLLLLSGLSLVFAAVAHVVTIYLGASAYHVMGFGPDMAHRAAEGDLQPALILGAIGLVLILGAYCAFAGARLLPRPTLGLLRLVLFSVTALLLGRGAIGVFLLTLLRLNGYHMETLYLFGIGGSLAFWIWSSGLCLLLGAIQLAGTSLSRDLY